jgi:hypothetical protein
MMGLAHWKSWDKIAIRYNRPWKKRKSLPLPKREGHQIAVPVKEPQLVV